MRKVLRLFRLNEVEFEGYRIITFDFLHVMKNLIVGMTDENRNRFLTEYEGLVTLIRFLEYFMENNRLIDYDTFYFDYLLETWIYVLRNSPNRLTKDQLSILNKACLQGMSSSYASAREKSEELQLLLSEYNS